MKKASLVLAVGLGIAFTASAAMADCNGETKACKVSNGTYHIVLPQGAAGPVPAIILLHGYGGEGLGTIRNKAMVNLMLGRGYAVIAPDGQLRSTGAGRSWDFHPDRAATRDEIAFLIAVADDAAVKYGLERDAMLLAGFSIGGSMTSYLACAEPTAFAAYAPVAGSFWRPHPAGCAGPVRLLHTHGSADTTVPLLGREVAPGFQQGNVFESIEIWRIADRCTSAEPDATKTQNIYTIQHWSDCAQGGQLDFALHEGGHSIPKGWAKMAMDWFEAP